MIELTRTSDPVRLSALCAALDAADIDHVVFDVGAGGLWQAAIPIRLMVLEDDLELAQRAIAQLGF